jgi:protease-4
VILKINVEGEIGTELFNKQTVGNLLIESRERALKDNRVKAIILNINTPGGTAIDSNAIYRLLKDYKAQYKVPIYAYVDGLCASGGMYIACAADKIYSSNISIIGSVGVVVGPFVNVYKLMEKYGVASETITAGKGKDEMNPFREWGPHEGENLKALTDYLYDHFIDVVATNRPTLDPVKLRNEYGAQIYPAAIAEKYGFIDGSDFTFNQALSQLAKEIGIDDEMYQVVELENNSWLASLFHNKINLGLLSGEIKHSVALPPQCDPKFMNQPLYLYRPE